MLFLLKIAITPLLVAAVSLAARWWGPTVGGILIGLPWFTGPTLFILVHEKDAAFGVAACAGVELGVVCVSAYVLAYGLTSMRASWPWSLAAGVLSFAACAWAVQDPALPTALTGVAVAPLWAAAALALASLAVTYGLLPVPRTPPVAGALPWWDIPMRMVTTGALVTVIMLGADVLGPQLSGIVSTFPVILTVIATFTHERWGREAVWGVLRGFIRSLAWFVGYFLIVGLALPATGLVGAYVIASVALIAPTAAMLRMSRTRSFP